MNNTKRGLTSYKAGQSAECIVERDYISRGHSLAARRFRKSGGEIDLILRKSGTVIFVEVKKSKSHALAAQSVSQRQLARIYTGATEFLADEPAGQDTPARIDIALVDAEGRVECLENVYTS